MMIFDVVFGVVPVPHCPTMLHFVVTRLINAVNDYLHDMRKMFAIIGALIGGGLGIALVSMGPQAAHAGVAIN